MTLPWFRLYTEFLTDPLIRMLAPSDRAHFIDVLCMKALGVLDKEYSSHALRNAVISRYVGVTATVTGNDTISQLDATRERLMAHGLIDQQWQPVNWEKRQFQKDTRDPTGAERQRKHRAKIAETLRNVTVTSTEQIQNRTDTDKKTPFPPSGLDLEAWAVWQGYRKLKPKSIQFAWKKLAAFGPDQMAVVEQSIANGWQGLFELKRSTRPTSRLRTAEEIEAEEATRGQHAA